MKRLLLATRNAGKVRELSLLLAAEPIQLELLGEHPQIPDAVESGQTFEENARIKASHAARASGLWSLGEDSGLEVDALGGRPGVYSARYAGQHGDDAGNNAKLVRELADAEDRRARYVCVMALADPRGEVTALARGVCEGHIELEPRGHAGFGYDPHFVPESSPKTMAELDGDAKSLLSHRGQALRAMLGLLRLHLGGEDSGAARASS